MSTKLLLLDESLLVQRVVELAFRGKEVEVLIAENGEEALEMAENAPPDLVVAGLDLEHTDGLDFCRRLRDKPQFAQLPLLVFTSTRNSVSDEEIEAVGALANIEKPFKPIVFTTEVERIIAPSESASSPESGGQAEPDSPTAAMAEETAEEAASPSEDATGESEETPPAPVVEQTPRPPAAQEEQRPIIDAPFALDSDKLSPVIEKHLEEAAEKIAPTLLRHIEEAVVKQLPYIVEKIVIREIEKIKRGE